MMINYLIKIKKLYNYKVIYAFIIIEMERDRRKTTLKNTSLFYIFIILSSY